MSRARGLHWQSTRDVYILANEIEKSVETSMRHFNSDCPGTCLKMRPTFIDDEVLKSAKESLKYEQNHCPLLIIEIETFKVEVIFLSTKGGSAADLSFIAKWEVVGSNDCLHSSEAFLSLIAYYCYKMVKHFRSCFGINGPKRVPCSMIFRFEYDQTSLKDSTVTKFDKNFYVQNCEGRDLVQMFNWQLMSFELQNGFRIICTHMLNFSTTTSTGYCMLNNELPDVFASLGLGCNIGFFESTLLNQDSSTQRMLVNTSISRFGNAIGSTEYNFLQRFLTLQDIELNDLQDNRVELYPLFITGFQMCEIVLRFFKKKIDDFLNKYKWLDFPNAIRVKDISNFLASIELNIELENSFKTAYLNLDAESRIEFQKLCQEIRERSASMLAGVVFGIVKRVARRCQKKQLTVCLAGEVLLEMHGYREKLKSTLQKLQNWHNRKNSTELTIELKCTEARSETTIYGAGALTKYIWTAYHHIYNN